MPRFFCVDPRRSFEKKLWQKQQILERKQGSMKYRCERCSYVRWQSFILIHFGQKTKKMSANYKTFLIERNRFYIRFIFLIFFIFVVVVASHRIASSETNSNKKALISEDEEISLSSCLCTVCIRDFDWTLVKVTRWPLLTCATFVGHYVKLALNTIAMLSLSKSLIHTVRCKYHFRHQNKKNLKIKQNFKNKLILCLFK